MSTNMTVNPVPEKQAAFKGRLNFCSNFYSVRFKYQGVDFPTSEHAFQWAKCKNKEDKDAILATSNPVDAKRIGKTVEMVDNWDNIKIGVMYDILKEKFNNPYLAKRLLDTGNEELIHENYWRDYFYGVCDGKGENWLGKILMRVRDELNANLQNNKQN